MNVFLRRSVLNVLLLLCLRDFEITIYLLKQYQKVTSFLEIFPGQLNPSIFGLTESSTSFFAVAGTILYEKAETQHNFG